MEKKQPEPEIGYVALAAGIAWVLVVIGALIAIGACEQHGFCPLEGLR